MCVAFNTPDKYEPLYSVQKSVMFELMVLVVSSVYQRIKRKTKSMSIHVLNILETLGLL